MFVAVTVWGMCFPGRLRDGHKSVMGRISTGPRCSTVSLLVYSFLSACLPVSLSLSIPFCQPVSLSLSIPFCQPVCLSLSVPFCLPVTSVRLSWYIPFCLSVPFSLPVSLFWSVPFCLSACRSLLVYSFLFVCPPVSLLQTLIRLLLFEEKVRGTGLHVAFYDCNVFICFFCFTLLI